MKKEIPYPFQLNGEKVILRTPNWGDASFIQKILSDPKTMENLKYMAHLPEGWTIDQVKKRLQKNQIEPQKQQRALHFVVIQKENNEIVGTCGFNSINLDHRNGNFGLILHHSVWGSGIAKECHLLCLKYAFEDLGLHRIEFGTFEKNTRMRKFFENLGIKLEGIQKESFFEEEKYIDNYLYVLFDFEWLTIKMKLEQKLSSQK